MRLAYADPPYPGRAHLYPENAEVDHGELFATLATYDGWALSTMSVTLREVLALAPEGVQVGAWVRTNAPPFNPGRIGAVRSWEPVVYMRARDFDHDADRVRDVCHAELPSGFRMQAGLPGTKPAPFAEWVFRIIGARPGDELHDLFPGSGAVGRAWERFSSQLSLLSGAA